MKLLKWIKSFLDTLADPYFSPMGAHILAIEQERRRIEIYDKVVKLEEPKP
jgi:hypothetical protein